MKKIFKYHIDYTSESMSLPVGAIILSVGMQKDKLMLWAIVEYDDDKRKTVPTEERLIRILGTGQDLTPEMEHGKFIGTVFNGPFVWHVFELPRPMSVTAST